jgi:hypothetical protein
VGRQPGITKSLHYVFQHGMQSESRAGATMQGSGGTAHLERGPHTVLIMPTPFMGAGTAHCCCLAPVSAADPAADTFNKQIMSVHVQGPAHMCTSVPAEHTSNTSAGVQEEQAAPATALLQLHQDTHDNGTQAGCPYKPTTACKPAHNLPLQNYAASYYPRSLQCPTSTAIQQTADLVPPCPVHTQHGLRTITADNSNPQTV